MAHGWQQGRWFWRGLAVLMIGVMLPVGAQAADANEAGAFMPVGVPAEAPAGFIAMCQRDALACRTPLDERDELAAPAVSALLIRVNAEVNKAIRFRADKQEYWQRPRSENGRKLEGDCEDYALEKRARLVEAGFPSDSLYLAVAYVPRAGLHTVLVARTAQGDQVLDNRTPWIVRWDEVDYVWLLRQTARSATGWSNLVYEQRARLAGL